MFFYIVLILLAGLVVLAFIYPFEVCLLLDGGGMKMRLSLSWIHLIKIEAENTRFSVYLPGTKIFSGVLARGEKARGAILRSLSLEDTRVKAAYGFDDPYLTGAFYGAFVCMESLMRKVTFEQIPEFLPVQEFIKIEVRSKLNAGKTAMNLMRIKSKESRGEETEKDQNKLNEHVDTLFHSLENFTQNEGIIGKPVVQGDKTFLPIVSITVGYGGGNASMKGQQGNQPGMGTNSGTGALGLGAKVSSDAVIVIDGQNVNMLPLNSNATNIMDKIPQIITSMNQGKQSGQPGQMSQEQVNSAMQSGS